MFSRREKRKAVLMITLWNARGEAVYDGPLNGLCLPEEIVRKLSVEFYNDPEPCHIHRGAVVNRAQMEIAHLCERETIYERSALPGRIRSFLSEYPLAEKLCVREVFHA